MLSTLNYWINSIILSIGLAMDSFSCSIVDAFNENKMSKKKIIFISFMFGLFQALMPFIGWLCVTSIVNIFERIEKFIPFISLLLLLWIGIDMLKDGLKKDQDNNSKAISLKDIIIQSIATSVDALSVGFTIASYNLIEALICISLIGIITFIICLYGCYLGKKLGPKLSNKASILGGIILIIIGIKIFIEGITTLII